MSAVDKINNAEAAVMELSMFFIRHSLPHWPAQMAPTLQLLRACEGAAAVDAWGRLALMGEYGLMQVQVTHIDGYRAADMDAEQRHFERLLQQALDGMNNLRGFLRTGANAPLLTIYPDSPPS
jgi:hypothetical protein